MGQTTDAMSVGLVPQLYRFDASSQTFFTVTSAPAPYSKTVSSIVALDSSHILTGGFLRIWSATSLATVLYTHTATTEHLFLACKNSGLCFSSDNATSAPMSVYRIAINNSTFGGILSVASNSLASYSGCTGVAVSFGDLVYVCDYNVCNFIYGSNLTLLNAAYAPGSAQVYQLHAYNDPWTGKSLVQLSNRTTAGSLGTSVDMFALYDMPQRPLLKMQALNDTNMNASGTYVQLLSTTPDGSYLYFVTSTPANNRIYFYQLNTACYDAKCTSCINSGTVGCILCDAFYSLNALDACVVCTPTIPNCLHCSGNSNNCSQCSAGYYVSAADGSCVTLAPGFFINAYNMSQPCDYGCAACSGTSAACSSCIVGFFLSGSACLPCNANCLTCQTSPTACTACPTGNWLFANATCGPCDTTAGWFTSGIGCSQCNANCLQCATSATHCTACPPSNVLLATSACQYCGPGSFILGSACLACSPNCLTCAGSAAACTTCAAGQFVSAANTTCEPVNAGFFLNATSNLTEACSANCVTCLGNASNCTSCAAGLSLSQTTRRCFDPLVSVALRVQANPKAQAQVDLSLLVEIASPSVTDSTLQLLIFNQLEKSVVFVNMDTPSAGAVTSNCFLTPLQTFAVLDCKLKNSSAKTLYTAVYRNLTMQNIFYYQGTPYVIQQYSLNSSYRSAPNVELPVAVESQARAIGIVTTMGTSEYSVDVAIGLSAFEPSGTLSRYLLGIKLFNRIYYLNVNFGELLSSFLKKLELISGTKTESYSYYYAASSLNGSRGKLTERRVGLDCAHHIFWKMMAYFGSWALKLLGEAAVAWRVKAGKLALVAVYFLPSLHLLVFNVVFLDLIFYCTHSAAHLVLSWSTLMAHASLFLVCVDLLQFVGLIFRTECWIKYFKISLQNSNIPNKLPLMNKKNASESIPKLSSNNRFTQIIDFQKTYSNLEHPFHLIQSMSSILKKNPKSFTTEEARIYLILNYSRIAMYQMLIVVDQETVFVGVAVLVLIEVLRISFAIRGHAVLKALDGNVVFLIEISQSIFLLFLLLVVSFLHLFPDSPLAVHPLQMVGIYLIICSVAIDTIMLIINFSIKLYYFIKDRAARNKIKNQSQMQGTPKRGLLDYWFMIYKVKPTNPNVYVFSRKFDSVAARTHDLDNPDNLKGKFEMKMAKQHRAETTGESTSQQLMSNRGDIIRETERMRSPAKQAAKNKLNNAITSGSPVHTSSESSSTHSKPIFFMKLAHSYLRNSFKVQASKLPFKLESPHHSEREQTTLQSTSSSVIKKSHINPSPSNHKHLIVHMSPKKHKPQ